MKQFVSIVFILFALQACKKHPHFPPHNCPKPAGCQLSWMHTSNAEATQNSGEPATTAVIFRDESGRPVTYSGYATNFTRRTTNLITYSGNRMIFTDSARGFKRLEVWLNACGQPDSTSWYKITDDYGQYPANIKFHYNSAKQLTRFVTYLTFSHGIVPFEATIHRDSYGNVTSIDDNAHRIELTYDYAAPVANMQWHTISAAFPEWAAVLILDQLGMIGFKTSHLPKTLQNWQGDYRFEHLAFSNFVLNGNKALSFEVRTHEPGSTDNGALRYVITSGWWCGHGGKGK